MINLKAKIWVGLSIISLILGFILVGLVAYWKLHSYKILEIESNPVVLNSPVKAGTNAIYTVSFCKYTNLTGEIGRKLVDGFTVDYPISQASYGEGCRNITASISIPDFVPSGKYIIHFVAKYHVNPLKDVEYAYNSGEFQIVNENF